MQVWLLNQSDSDIETCITEIKRFVTFKPGIPLPLDRHIALKCKGKYSALAICDNPEKFFTKEKPFKLIELERRIAKVSQDPISTSMLKVDGNRVMELLELKPGREVGLYLNALLEEVLEDPSLNTIEYLEKRVKEIKI